jgi:hypothetical protein
VSSGRTSWFGKDAGWWRRDYIIALVDQFGPAGPAIIDYICCECAAQEGYEEGTVKTNHRAIMRDTGVDLVTLLAVLDVSVGLGLLEDFEALNGNVFVCRISGWRSDRERSLASVRKARSRASHVDDDVNVTSHENRPPKQNKTTQNKASSSSTANKEEVESLFAYWKERCKHPTARLGSDRRAKVQARLKEGYSVEQIRKAIDGAALDAYVNDKGVRFDDLELICRNGSKLELFIKRASGGDSGERGMPHGLGR